MIIKILYYWVIRDYRIYIPKLFQAELQRISKIITTFPREINEKIDKLIINDDGILSLNDIRYNQKDFTYTEIIEEVKKVQELYSIYKFCKVQIAKLGLSQNAIRYYSGNVEQYLISGLRKILQKILEMLNLHRM